MDILKGDSWNFPAGACDFMEYDAALAEFGKCYMDQRKEFAIIFQLCDFRKKFILEIGSGSECHFIKELLKKTTNIMATDISEKKLQELEKKLKVQTKACSAETLPFYDRSFDIVFSRWVVQHTDEQKAVNEMCRVADKFVLMVLPNEQGDETTLKSLVEKNNADKRKKRIDDIKRHMTESGFIIKEKRTLLKFRFMNVKTAAEVLSAVAFNNKLSTKEKEKITEFLSKKQKGKITMTQGASFILGVRK